MKWTGDAIRVLARRARTFAAVALETKDLRYALKYLRVRVRKHHGLDLALPFSLDGRRKTFHAIERDLTAPLPDDAAPCGNYAVVPSLLPVAPLVVSAGIGRDLRFDEALLAMRPEARLLLVDPTPSVAEYLADHPVRARVDFHPVALLDYDGTARLYSDSLHPQPMATAPSLSIRRRGIDRHSSLDVPSVRIDTLLRQTGHDRIDLLKMDIEGAAPRVLRSMLEASIHPRQIVCEIEMASIPLTSGERDAFVRETRELLSAFAAVGYVLHNSRTVRWKKGRSLEVLMVRRR